MDVFYQPDLGVIVENLAPDGSLLDCFEGRRVNPGHDLEAMWFLMNIGIRRNDRKLIDKAAGTKGQSSEAGLHLELKYCYSVEGGAELAKQITKGVVPVVGSIYVEQYLGAMKKFAPALEQAIKSTGGVMVFDISHLNKHKLWGDLETSMRKINQ